MLNNNLYVAGGCMITQTGLLPSKLFPQVLKKKIEDQIQQKVSVKLEIYSESLEIHDKVIRWAESHASDNIIIQYRPAILLRRLKIFMRENDRVAKYILNPALKTKKSDEIYQELVDKELATKKHNYFKQDKI